MQVTLQQIINEVNKEKMEELGNSINKATESVNKLSNALNEIEVIDHEEIKPDED